MIAHRAMYFCGMAVAEHGSFIVMWLYIWTQVLRKWVSVFLVLDMGVPYIQLVLALAVSIDWERGEVNAEFTTLIIHKTGYFVP